MGDIGYIGLTRVSKKLHTPSSSLKHLSTQAIDSLLVSVAQL